MKFKSTGTTNDHLKKQLAAKIRNDISECDATMSQCMASLVALMFGTGAGKPDEEAMRSQIMATLLIASESKKALHKTAIDIIFHIQLAAALFDSMSVTLEDLTE